MHFIFLLILMLLPTMESGLNPVEVATTRPNPAGAASTGVGSVRTIPAGAISGSVTNEVGGTLSYAHVALPEINRGSITKRDGTFLIENLPDGDYLLVVSHVGYQPSEKRVTVIAGQRTEVAIGLSASNEMPQIEIVGRSPERLSRIPGSASVVTAQRLRETEPLNATEIFREIPGVQALNHDGMGLRTNIGIRGLDPDLSRNVLMLEDGIPVALAPYGEPEMYYSPPISRMSSVEVIKGSGSIMFGPRTIGGVINFVTADPPAEPAFNGYFSGGERGYRTARIGYGSTFGKSGFQITYLRRQGENIGPLKFRLNDLNAKWKLTMGNRSMLGIKMGIYDELSNATYIGLSQPMFESGRYDFTDLATSDELEIRRYSASLTHDYYFSDHVHLRTAGYAYTTRRNWSRQDFDNQPVDGREYDRIIGDPSVPFGAIYFRPTTGNRNREFEVAGIEPRLSARFHVVDFRNDLDAGFRLLYERAFEQRINGSVISPKTGNIREDEIRTGHAVSGFLQNRLYVTQQFTVTPGLRVEHFRYERDIYRDGFEDVRRTSDDNVLAFIPGIGLNYRFGPESSLFAGLHRGFSPPRIKDAISSAGVSEELDSEWSWSYETGFRLRPHPYLRSEITAYYMNFENQIIPVSESSGGQGIPNAVGLTNGGATLHYGVEFLFQLNPVNLFGTRTGLDWDLGGSWNQAYFNEDRFVASGDQRVNVRNNHLPYAPDLSGFSRITLRHEIGFSGYLKAVYTGDHYGDVLNRGEASGNGRQGRLDGYTVFDAGMRYHLPAGMRSSLMPAGLNATLSVSVKNLTDERYIASRRPQGIRLGLPRIVTFGLEVSL